MSMDLRSRALRQILPEDAKEGTMRFGAKVFYRGLKHVGIALDAHSFYHASASRYRTSMNIGRAGYSVTGASSRRPEEERLFRL